MSDQVRDLEEQVRRLEDLLRAGRRYAMNCIDVPAIDYATGHPIGFQSRAELWVADVDFELRDAPKPPVILFRLP
jgi:hypothetical protein